MNPLLRSLFRLVFFVWLFAVLICGVVVAQKTHTPMYGASLLTFLFTKKLPFSLGEPPSMPSAPPIGPEEEEEPIVEPSPPPPPAPAQVLRPIVPSGPKAGKGSLSKPVFSVLADGSIEVRIAYKGTLGQKRSLHAPNVASVSLDLIGKWSGLSGNFTPPDTKLIKKLQVGLHADRVRFSALAHDPAKPTSLRGEMYQEEGAIVLVFINAQPSRPGPAATPSVPSAPTAHTAQGGGTATP